MNTFHYSIRFEGLNEKFHGQFMLYSKTFTQQEVIDRAIFEIKKKCKSYFYIKYERLIGIEIYYYPPEAKGEEVMIFEKEKNKQNENN